MINGNKIRWFLLIHEFWGVCRFKVSVADVIRSQYSDQVSVGRLVVSWSSLCGHSVCRSVNVCLCVSGSLWRTSSLELFASSWSGFQRYPIMPRSTEWVNSSLCYFSQTFLTLFCVSYFFRVCFLLRPLCPSLLTHCSVFFICSAAAGDAAAVWPVLPEQGCSVCGPSLCLHGESKCLACESPL